MASAEKQANGDEAAEEQPPSLAAVLAAGDDVSHNLNGQKLGRKGRGTRERILTACTELLAESGDQPISMSAVARRAELGMTSLYNYFSDLTELLLAVLEPVVAESEHAFLAMLRERWPDEVLGERCQAFMQAYFGFWSRNSRLLHLRNSMSDAGDRRMMMQRVRATQPVILLIAAQMDGDPDDLYSWVRGMATVVMTGVERTVTVATDHNLVFLFGPENRRQPDHYLMPEARLIELAIRDARASVADKSSSERGGLSHMDRPSASSSC